MSEATDVALLCLQALVIDYNLPYPTGTAVGTMIRSFFNDGTNARQQAFMMCKVSELGRFSTNAADMYRVTRCCTLGCPCPLLHCLLDHASRLSPPIAF